MNSEQEKSKPSKEEAEKPKRNNPNKNLSLENFNWDSIEKRPDENIATADVANLYEELSPDIKEGQIMQGKIVDMLEGEVIINFNGKSEGVIILNEFRYMSEKPKVGDTIEFMIEKLEDKTGQMVVSHKKAKDIKNWHRALDAFEKEEIIEGEIIARTRGGMIVSMFDMEVFLPGSQIDVRPIKDYAQYVGKVMELKVVKINHEHKNIVVSHKALIQEDIEKQRKEIISTLEKGQVLKGVVKNITKYGAFIDLGGIDGLIYITDLSWNRVKDPNEIVALDQELEVVILDFNAEKTKIQLGLKQLQPSPWQQLDEEKFKVGEKVKGKVISTPDYGALVEVASGVEGLLHFSEISWSNNIHSVRDYLEIGDEIECVILNLDKDNRRLSLGMKQLTPDPWEDIEKKHPINSVRTGTVKNFANFGIFLELEKGIEGLIFIGDLSWVKKIHHPSDFTSIGSQLEVKVLNIDKEKRKLSLGHKQVKPNPWHQFSRVYTESTMHKATVKEILDRKGGIIVFGDNTGLEGFVPYKHLMKEDQTFLSIGEVAEFEVIEFNPDNRKLVLSHTNTHKSNARDMENQKRSSTSTTDAQSKKTTLGNFDAFTKLKAEIEANKKEHANKKSENTSSKDKESE